ncbi:MAG TPA: DNA-primase RepB domain-containing protein [Candidatus Acidoferrum sp.]|nr:DNA-primase RepB domain-containing protein [Candidatus Acidoferrum sp.]
MTAVNSFTPRQLSAAQYVLALHQPEDRVAMLVRNRSRAQTIQRILLAEHIASPSFQDWLKEQNNGGADIFVGMNPLRANSLARTKESVREIRHVYLDLDEDGPASLRALRTDGNTPVPNFVLDTSPEKNQVVWRVDGLDREQAEVLLRSLADQFQGDMAATDISRVLRVPGFANRKYNEEFVVRAIQQSDAIYQPRDFTITEDSPESPRRLSDGHNTTRRIPAGHRSQSEADWAYAKRALARGDDPQQVIQRIADYRSDDKADPLYYARHTVEKAQAASHRDWQRDPSQALQDLNQRTEFRPPEAIADKAEQQDIDRR